jgi:hypothetical protein
LVVVTVLAIKILVMAEMAAQAAVVEEQQQALA